MQGMVYLDNAATTRCDPRVVEAMLPFLNGAFGNPASTAHQMGRTAANAVQSARANVAHLVGARTDEIVWTSGATESINLALQGVVLSESTRIQRIITFSSEHRAVLDTAHAVARGGTSVVTLDPLPDGRVDLEQLKEAIGREPALVSVMFVNNEIGVVQDIGAIAKVVHDSGGLLHVDSAQATGKVSIDVNALDIDLMSMCAHKTYGPKGVGALYVRAELQRCLRPVIYGGGHEKGLRSGTLPTHQLVGFGEAFRLAKEVEAAGDEIRHLRELRDRLLACLMSLDGVAVNGSMLYRVPHNLNVRFTGIDADALLQMMPDVCLSTGSACSSGIPEPSHVLRALGLSVEEAEGSVRITLGRFTTVEDIDFAADSLIKSVSRLREVTASL